MSTSARRRAVITGMGVLSPIGLDPQSVWNSLREKRTGVKPITTFDPSGMPVRIAGEIPEFDAKKFLSKENRRALKMMARTIQLAVCAAELAMADTGYEKGKVDPTRFGVEFGAGLIASELPEIAEASRLSANCAPGAVDLEKWGDLGIPAIQPLWMLKYLPNMPACHVAILQDAQGPNNTVTESDVASILALGEAYRILCRDQADFFVVGGAESKMNPLSMVRQCLFEPLSHRNDAPAQASRPFDRRRDGMVLGEGAGVMIVEELEHAKKRGAKIYAELVGFGSAFDLRQDGKGLARALRAALADAGIGPEDVDHVNAHGLGSIPSDVWEAQGLNEVFGNRREPVPVFAPKGYLGNLGAAGGTTELILSLIGLQHGVAPASLNFEEPDPAAPVNVIAGAPRPMTKPYFAKVGFTQPGQVGAVVLRKWDA